MSRKRSSDDFDSMGKLIHDLLKSTGLEESAARRRAVAQWPIIVGRAVSGHSAALHLSNRILYVEVDSSPWMNELSAIKTALLTKINKTVGGAPGETIIDIRFRQRSGAGIKVQAPPQETPPTAQAPAPEDMRTIARILAPIEDEDLKSLLEGILVKDRTLKNRRQANTGRPSPLTPNASWRLSSSAPICRVSSEDE